MGHTHVRHDAGKRSTTAPLVIALVVTLGIVVLEIVGGIISGSLALLTDSAHVFMDALALGIAVFAGIAARRPATAHRSFGYARFEMLAALANGALLIAVTIFVVVAAVHRFFAPAAPEGAVMSAFAAVGLLVNLGLGALLARSAHGDLNMRAALFHIAGDVAGSAAIAIGGLIVASTGAAWIDPALSLLVAALIVIGVVQILREATDVLLESAPGHATLPVVRARMRAQSGVVDVHDLHVWTIGSGSHVLTAHVLLADKRISEASSILRDLERELHDAFDIHHVTIQFECESCEADDRIVCVNERSPESAAGRRLR